MEAAILKRLYHKLVDSATRELRQENREFRERLIHIEDKQNELIERAANFEDKENELVAFLRNFFDLRDGIIECQEKLNRVIAKQIQE